MMLPQRTSTSAEVLVGRTLAAVVHPVAAWRSRSTAFRVHLVVGYFVAGYVLTLIAVAATRGPA